ncbi:protein ALP1-like [Thrips palmi]|uniref:Protein ALP1-like n=1 Tax=Thrips palmi TaxID=161013 RepID=A0A6P8ZK69_THRPL|nr:protein ALP1-like [Thrips palmi]
MAGRYHVWKMWKRLPRRRWWVRPVNRPRVAHGFYNNLFTELMTTDHEEFFDLFRMSPEQFNLLVNFVHPFLEKHSIRTPLPTKLRLAVTLMFFSQGITAKLQHAEYRIGRSTVFQIIHETSRAIWEALQPTVLKFPDKEEWKKIADGFQQKWQFPNCISAMDGKHMRIKAPPNSGSNWYNYKGFFSMVLLATCDANYKFTWIDIGQYGSISDGGVWSNPDLAADLEANRMNLPDPTPLQGMNVPFPYFFVGDEAFPLTKYMMRPYPKRELTDEKRIFNYRLSRARRTIENSFGILAARWLLLQKPLSMSPDNLEAVFKALVCLHNFLMMSEEMKNAADRMYAPADFVDVERPDGTVTEGRWREVISPYFQDLGRAGGNRSNHIAVGMRDYLQAYINSELGYDQCQWQARRALRGHDLNMEQ